MKFYARETPEVIFFDNHVVVVFKPGNMCTQPDQENNLHDWVRNWVKVKFNKKGDAFAHAIHRLDSKASGLVIFAKTSKALSRLNESMKNREIKKTYLALVEGKVNEKGTLINYLDHDDFRAKIVDKSLGKEAILHYELLKTDEKTSLLNVILETGRYHQIRAQFSNIGHPIVGDQKYGSKTRLKSIYLQHYQVEFPHPVLNKNFNIKLV